MIPAMASGTRHAQTPARRLADRRSATPMPWRRALCVVLLGAVLVSPGLAAAATAAPPTAGGALPPSVRLELQRAGIPAEALSVVVHELGQDEARLHWQHRRLVNPASLMKLLTTAAALDRLGPAWTWTTPVWLAGPVRDGVLEGDLHIRGSGDPQLVIERLWLLLRRVQAAGVREIRGDIVLDHSAFDMPPGHPADFDGEPLRPYNVRADALLLNFHTRTWTFRPDLDAGVARVSVDPPLAPSVALAPFAALVPPAPFAALVPPAPFAPLAPLAPLAPPMPGPAPSPTLKSTPTSTPAPGPGPGPALSRSVPLQKGPCGDWRRNLQADFSAADGARFGGAYASACGELSWPVADPDPSTYNARLLTQMWQDLGGRLGGRVRAGPAPATVPSFEVKSAPLSEVVRDINKFSNNVMAQQLFLTLALQDGALNDGALRDGGPRATPEAARRSLRRWLEERIGLPEASSGTAAGSPAGTEAGESLVIDNGSGLSRQTRVTALLLARVLQKVWDSPTMPELMASLPIAGLDGTLRRSRVSGGRAHLKTGSLRDVQGLAGYVLSHGGRRYVLVGIVQHPQAGAARPALDALVQWVLHDTPRRPPGP